MDEYSSNGNEDLFLLLIVGLFLAEILVEYSITFLAL